MQLAFVLYKYFPFGGLQRDFMRIALECQARGHAIRVYTPIWEGEVPAGFDVRVAPIKAFFNHPRNEKFSAWLAADLARDPVDRVVGFNKMPGLDVYYAADGCYEDKAQTLRAPIYKRWGRYKHFADYERAVFGRELAQLGVGVDEDPEIARRSTRLEQGAQSALERAGLDAARPADADRALETLEPQHLGDVARHRQPALVRTRIEGDFESPGQRADDFVHRISPASPDSSWRRSAPTVTAASSFPPTITT